MRVSIKKGWCKVLKQIHDIPQLETEHLILREIFIEDADALFAFMKDHDTMKFITPHPVQSIKEMQEKIQAHLAGFKNQTEIPWVVVDKQLNKPIGFFRLHKLDLWHKKAELGVVIHPSYQQKGVMTEILERILPFVFNDLQLNRLVGDIFADNQGSKRILEKFSFHKDGVLRQTDFDGETYHDTVVYSLLREEYFNERGR
jgi:ribosomal-protein-alanine N-acetyltransferase